MLTFIIGLVVGFVFGVGFVVVAAVRSHFNDQAALRERAKVMPKTIEANRWRHVDEALAREREMRENED